MMNNEGRDDENEDGDDEDNKEEEDEDNGHPSEVLIWLIWGIKVVCSTYFFVFSYFSVERIVFYFGLSTQCFVGRTYFVISRI